jgi:hypothetical protein
MQGLFLCGAPSSEVPLTSHLKGFSLRIRERGLSEAISASAALKRPERSFGAMTDSRASASPKDRRACTFRSFACGRVRARERPFGNLWRPAGQSAHKCVAAHEERRASSIGGTMPCGCLGVLAQNVLEAGMRHGFATSVEEQFRRQDRAPSCPAPGMGAFAEASLVRRRSSLHLNRADYDGSVC